MMSPIHKKEAKLTPNQIGGRKTSSSFCRVIKKTFRDRGIFVINFPQFVRPVRFHVCVLVFKTMLMRNHNSEVLYPVAGATNARQGNYKPSPIEIELLGHVKASFLHGSIADRDLQSIDYLLTSLRSFQARPLDHKSRCLSAEEK